MRTLDLAFNDLTKEKKLSDLHFWYPASICSSWLDFARGAGFD